MKAWTDLQAIAIPTRMNWLPKDERGYPVPASATVGEDGKPDFRVINIQKSLRLIRGQACHLCGQPLGQHVAFVGGPRSMEARTFTDGGMHRECAEYALQVCPFLAAPRFAYARDATPPEGVDVQINENVSVVRPDKFGLGITKLGYSLYGKADNFYIIVREFHTVEWWKDGRKLP